MFLFNAGCLNDTVCDCVNIKVHMFSKCHQLVIISIDCVIGWFSAELMSSDS